MGDIHKAHVNFRRLLFRAECLFKDKDNMGEEDKSMIPAYIEELHSSFSLLKTAADKDPELLRLEFNGGFVFKAYAGQLSALPVAETTFSDTKESSLEPPPTGADYKASTPSDSSVRGGEYGASTARTHDETEDSSIPVAESKRITAQALRERLLGGRAAIDNAVPTSLGDAIDIHKQEQASLEGDLRGLAQQLRESSMGLHRRVKQDTEVLEGTEALTSANLERVGTERERMKTVVAATSSWFAYKIIAAVVVIFILMNLWIRVFSKQF